MDQPCPATDQPTRSGPAAPIKLLASVADDGEADLALALGADLLDLKDPRRGALGAWPAAALRRTVDALAGRRTTSAPVGDLPMEPDLLLASARRMAATGVDIVKIGFFASDRQERCAHRLAEAAREGVRLVAVLMADQAPNRALLPLLREAGFHGAMLDTADKSRGLRHHLPLAAIERFVAEAKALGLLSGLAGSLRVDDIAPLAALGPDYLGFRGALCRGDRQATLDRAAFLAVRSALDQTLSS